jgi:hypothetical protein
MRRSSTTGRASAFTSRTTTQFTKNVNDSVASGVSLVIDPTFRTMLAELITYLDFYAIGDYPSIQHNLTSAKYIALSGSLGRLIITDPTTILLRTLAMNSLQGLQRAYIQYNQLVNTANQLTIAANQAAILDNMDLLKAFLLKLNTASNTSIFGEYTIESSVPAVIPPAYLQYIQTYGYPQDGVFNTTLLAGMG